MHKHNWKRDDNDPDSVDIFVLDRGYHNGPQCIDCGAIFCKHCHPERMDEECPGVTGSPRGK